jgi:hypothetical protein
VKATEKNSACRSPEMNGCSNSMRSSTMSRNEKFPKFLRNALGSQRGPESVVGFVILRL